MRLRDFEGLGIRVELPIYGKLLRLAGLWKLPSRCLRSTQATSSRITDSWMLSSYCSRA